MTYLGPLKHYHILAIALFILFGVSVVLLSLEKAEKTEPEQIAKRALNSQNQAVQGQSIVKDEAIVRYQDYAQRKAAEILAFIKRLEATEPVAADELSQLEQSLLSAKIPGSYQDLHFRLVKIIRELRPGEKADLDFLQEQTRTLAKDFSWLFPSSSP